MNFYFDSLTSFLDMGGHGVYVWFCYIVTILVFCVLIFAPILKKRSFLKQQSKSLRNAKIKR